MKPEVTHRSDLGARLIGAARRRAGASWPAFFVFLALVPGTIAPNSFAQRNSASTAPAAADPAQALQEALTAACRHEENTFAGHLTSDSADAYRALNEDQRVALMRRMVLLDDPGKPLLSTSGGHTVVRCEAGGVISEMRFSAAEVRENLAFIPVNVPEGGETRSVRFGLVRESGQWKLLSVGLLILNIPALAQQWQESELQTRERDVMAAMRKVASALRSYQNAYGNLPETLEQLGPPAQGGASPEKAGLLDSELAKGVAGGYRLRYSIVPASGEENESERNKAAGFALAATPIVYRTDGRRSFFLDATGTLRGADKNGVVATADDPAIGDEGRR